LRRRASRTTSCRTGCFLRALRDLEELSGDFAPLDRVAYEPRAAPDPEVALCANLGIGGHNVALVAERA
jgi:3-oxoacyl-[acyl-carrier-protein] synthase II